MAKGDIIEHVHNADYDVGSLNIVFSEAPNEGDILLFWVGIKSGAGAVDGPLSGITQIATLTYDSEGTIWARRSDGTDTDTFTFPLTSASRIGISAVRIEGPYDDLSVVNVYPISTGANTEDESPITIPSSAETAAANLRAFVSAFFMYPTVPDPATWSNGFVALDDYVMQNASWRIAHQTFDLGDSVQSSTSSLGSAYGKKILVTVDLGSGEPTPTYLLGIYQSSLNSFETFNMPMVIPKNTATAALRRIPIRLFENVLGEDNELIPADITVTGEKVSLSFGGGSPADSTNDIVKVNGATGRYYLELTQSEANTALGPVDGSLQPTGCALTYMAAVIGPEDSMTAGDTSEDIADAIITAAGTTPIPANVKEINDATVLGNGTDADLWRGDA